MADPEAECVDMFEECPRLADEGYCETDPYYMMYNCKKSCAVCGMLVAMAVKFLQKDF